MKAPAALLCLWPMAVSAFASSTSASKPLTVPTSFTLKNKLGHHHSQHKHHNNLHTQQQQSTTATQLHLSIPRGGAIASTAAIITSKLSSWTSTPSGSFNVALAVLAASTAVLKLKNKVVDMPKEDGVVEVRRWCGGGYWCSYYIISWFDVFFSRFWSYYYDFRFLTDKYIQSTYLLYIYINEHAM